MKIHKINMNINMIIINSGINITNIKMNVLWR